MTEVAFQPLAINNLRHLEGPGHRRTASDPLKMVQERGRTHSRISPYARGGSPSSSPVPIRRELSGMSVDIPQTPEPESPACAAPAADMCITPPAPVEKEEASVDCAICSSPMCEPAVGGGW